MTSRLPVTDYPPTGDHPKGYGLRITVYGLLITFLVGFSASAAVPSDTRDYLRNTAQSDWITMARVAAGDTGVPTNHLRDNPGTEATDWARRILAIVAAGENPTNFASTNWVAKLSEFFDGTQIGVSGLLNDDAWGILALRAAGISADDNRVQISRNVLLNNQNSDGGWGFAKNSGSDTNDTAAVLEALAEAGLSASDARIDRGLNYLKNSQRSNGGIGFASGSDPDTASTAWVVTAFTKFNFVSEAQKAQSWLFDQRRSDGSFRWRPSDTSGTPLMTAYAAIALADASFPVRPGVINNPPPVAPPLTRVNVSYRIEGREARTCQGSAQAANPLDLLEQVRVYCNLTLDIRDTILGRYVRGINNDTAQGELGWLYRVNWRQPEVGAADYRLASGDEVLWYYGRFDAKAVRIVLERNTIYQNESARISVQVWSETNQRWESPAAGLVTVRLAGRTILVDETTETVSGLSVGHWEITAAGERIIRPVPVLITVQAVPPVPPAPVPTPTPVPVPQPLPLPTANFIAAPVNGTAPLRVIFKDTSLGQPTRRAWDFQNDGVFDSFVVSPSFVYQIPGAYTVRLTVTNAQGSDDEIKSDYVKVAAPPPPPLPSSPPPSQPPAQPTPPAPPSSPPPRIDSDRDGLSDHEEAVYRTNPNSRDTDGDGYDDLTEIRSGYDPLSKVPCPVRSRYGQTVEISLRTEQCWAAYLAGTLGRTIAVPPSAPQTAKAHVRITTTKSKSKNTSEKNVSKIIIKPLIKIKY